MHGQEGEHQEHVRDRARRPRQVHPHRLSCLQGENIFLLHRIFTELWTESTTIFRRLASSRPQRLARLGPPTPGRMSRTVASPSSPRESHFCLICQTCHGTFNSIEVALKALKFAKVQNYIFLTSEAALSCVASSLDLKQTSSQNLI